MAKFLTNLDLQKNELQNATVQNLATPPSSPVQGQIYYDTVADAIKVYDGAAWQTLATGGGTVTSVSASSPLSSTGGNTPTISIQDGTTSQKGAVQLEDSYSSTSTSKAATPAAVKAAYDLANGKANPTDTTYVGTTAVALNRSSANLALTGISSVALPGSTSGTITVQPTAVAGTNTITLPAATGTVALTSDIPSLTSYATKTGVETLTNKTLTSPVVDGSGVLFEGATPDANRTTLTVVDPTATRTITLPNASGTVALTSDLSSFLTSAVTSIAGTTNEIEVSASTGSVTVGLPDNVSITGTLTVGGDLTVNGTVATINSTTITVDDKNIELGSVTSPTDTTANGGGITLKGTTDKTINWVSSTGAWTLSEHLALASGKKFYINGTEVLSSTTLGSGVTGSSLTSVGTIGSGIWQGTAVGLGYGGTGATTASDARANLAESGFSLARKVASSSTWTAGQQKTLTHNLGTKDVTVAVYDSGDELVYAEVLADGTNAVKVTISLAGTYRYAIVG